MAPKKDPKIKSVAENRRARFNYFIEDDLEAGIMPPKHDLYCESTRSIYRRGEPEWDYAGYATSFLFSSLLKTPIAIAKLPNELAKPGTEVELEISVIRKPRNVLAQVVRMPFFNPSRKTESPTGKSASC